eukprot:Rhum_TRINITY_DN3819_c0_g1::Rhum_TRINITY_DN3819_c0_g1_i1::g.12146::m.12146
MTTVEREHEFRMFCQGSSNKRMYKEMCHRVGIKRNSQLCDELADVTNRFDLKTLELKNNYLGCEGVRALLAVVAANEGLEHLGLSDQGVDDACLSDLVRVLREHPRLTSVDLSHNMAITNVSSSELISVLKDNTMLCKMDVAGCRIAASHCRKLQELARYNMELEPVFFRGDYLRMKALFMQLDSDMSGRITLSELLTNIEIPNVAATLLARLQHFSEQKDTVTINEFLDFVYPHYKSVASIKKYSKEDDVQDVNTARNHLTFFNCLQRKMLVADHYKLLRIRDRILTEAEVGRVVDRAIELESALHVDGVPQRGRRMLISYSVLKTALSEVWQPVLLTLDQIRKEFRLSPTLIKQICSVFASGDEVGISEILGMSLETPLVKLQLRILVPIVQKYGLPTSCMPITLQETVTLLEEYYDTLCYDKC